jgi:hypothetical protein
MPASTLPNREASSDGSGAELTPLSLSDDAFAARPGPDEEMVNNWHDCWRHRDHHLSPTV